MASTGMQTMASALCLLGWAGVILSCILPMWKVSAFVGSTIVTSQKIWEGIWMTCVVQSTGQMSCKPYDSMLALTSDVQAARALVVLAIVTGAAGLLLAFIGGKCTRFLDDDQSGAKGKVALAAGVVLLTSGVFCLIPTSWTAGAVVRKFYSASNDAQRRELGACLYIGWGASILLVAGGALLIRSACPLRSYDADKSPSVRYLVVRSSNGSTPAGSHRSRVPSTASYPIRAMSASPRARAGLSPVPPPYTSSPFDPQSTSAAKEESERSWAPSSPSVVKRPESQKSDLSEPLSTKSQLKRAEMEMEETTSVKSETEEVASNAAKTYL